MNVIKFKTQSFYTFNKIRLLFNLVKSVAFDSLSEKGRLEFLKEFSKKVCPNHFNEAFNFVKKQAPLYYKFANIKFLRENKKNICFNKNFKKYLSIDDFIILVQKRFLKPKIDSDHQSRMISSIS